MTGNDVLETVYRVTAEMADYTPEGDIDKGSLHLENDLALDSLDLVDLIMRIDDAYDGVFGDLIKDGDYESWKTVGDIAKYVKEKIEEAEPPA